MLLACGIYFFEEFCISNSSNVPVNSCIEEEKNSYSLSKMREERKIQMKPHRSHMKQSKLFFSPKTVHVI